MRNSTSRDRNMETRDHGGLMERLIFVPGAIVLAYGFWLVLAA